ncbi:MAG: cytochrome b/b6 domain-containing protein [Magnetococcales bacterium]|nr:cytochrome b/b6 domain-containing protein [Magnetococcales bacterium]
MASHKELFFTRFERFWHWGQALLVLILMFTGLEVAQAYALLGYADATHWHNLCAWSLICLWIFTIFWHIITGEWRQYRWTTDKLGAVFHYYTTGIFSKKIRYHPFKKTRRFKHNPLQRIAYLLLSLVIMPLIGLSGLLYFYYDNWEQIALDRTLLSPVAAVHLCMAFALLVFIILHIYMSFTGTPLMSQLQAMLTGYVVIEDTRTEDREEFTFLLVTEDRDFAQVVLHGLQVPPPGMESLHMEHAVTLKEGMQRLEQHSYDMVMLDLELSDGPFLENIARIQALDLDTPLVVFSGDEAYGNMELVMRKGVVDFLIKQEIGRNTLIRVIQHALFRIRFDRCTR